jgi:hypothetical protein
MYSWKLLAITVITVFAGGCSVVPKLDEATGTQGLDPASGKPKSDVLVSDVVRRVKCEIAEAFAEKVEDPHFRWMAGWAAKVDLTLQANLQGGVTPGVTYTSYYKNAFNFAAGSTSLTNKAIPAVSQFFSFGAGLNYSEQAVRSEVISFSLSLRELKKWKADMDRLEAALPPERRVCALRNETELLGGLGLKEWINASLYPVENSDLFAGIHPSPASISKPSGPVGAPPKTAAEILTYGDAKARVNSAADKADKAKDAAVQSYKMLTASSGQISGALVAITKSKEYLVLEPHLRHAISQAQSDLAPVLKDYDKKVSDAATAAETAYNDIIAVKNTVSAYKGKHTKPDGTAVAEGKPDDDDLVPDLANLVASVKDDAKFAEQQATYAATQQKKLADYASSLKNFHPDPPVDSLLHSVQFVVTYGASLSPSWTLLQWKGPSPAGGSTGSATGQRTHLLNIALGPVGSGEQNRLIQNQLIFNGLPH